MGDFSAVGKLNIAVCDDQPVMLEQLRVMAEQALAGRWELEIAGDTSPARLLETEADFQIVVLDIQLPEGSGIAFAREVLRRNPECRIIFVTGYTCYVSDVYDVPHLGMVLKEGLQKHLPKFLLRAAEEVSALPERALTVNVRGEDQRLPLSNIYYLERKGHITRIRLRSGQQVQSREKLSTLLAQVPDQELCRCHISYAVNLRWVESLRGRDFVLAGGETIPISRANTQTVKNAFFRYLRETVAL